MGHNIGVSASYYKPKEKEVLEDYKRKLQNYSKRVRITNMSFEKNYKKKMKK
jgi:hypothetical protein